MTSNQPVTEADLQAYADERLADARRAEVEAWLATRPEDAERIAGYRAQRDMLHALYDPVLDEPVPERLRAAMRGGGRSRAIARVAGWVALGAALGVLAGWQLRALQAPVRVAQGEGMSMARRAAVAHVTYSPEIRHPVEVGADQEAHLVAWLSKRLGTPLNVPHLGTLGYSLVGGRLLPGERGPVAQFMYQDARGARLTLYVRTNADENRETYFRFAQERGVGVFYWLDRKLGYALSGEIDKSELLRVATAVYRQLNP